MSTPKGIQNGRPDHSAKPCPDGDSCPDARKYGAVHAERMAGGDPSSKIEACLCGSDALQMESDFLSDDSHVECGQCGRSGQHGVTEGEAWQRWNEGIAMAKSHIASPTPDKEGSL